VCDACAAVLPAALPAVRPPGLRSLHALYTYEGPVRPLMAALKFRGATALAGWLAVRMALLAGVDPAATWVAWAPTTAARRRERGYDQAQLLAAAVGAVLGLPVAGVLVRRGRTHQTGHVRAQRLRDPPVFAPARHVPLPGAVLLVDDVCTTGATLSAAAAALRRAGSGPVHGLVVARTP
jgi:predicted amidophosphoribosyltransferase